MDAKPQLSHGIKPDQLWDAFVSHAREDNAAVVEPLVSELQRRGYRIWYDRYEPRRASAVTEEPA